MPHLASPRVARSIVVTAFGGLFLLACAQGETLDGFGGALVTSGAGGGSGSGKVTGTTTSASTSAQASSASSTKAASSSSTTAASTTAATTSVATTVTVVSSAAVTTGGAVCFDVCADGPPPPPTYPLDCIGDQNTLACITGICIGSQDCCNVAWDSTCVIAATLACGCP